MTFALLGLGLVVPLATRFNTVQGVEGLLLGIMGDVVPGAGRYPAEETETRLLAPASLSAGAAIPGPADSQLLGSARTDRKQQVCRDDRQDNSTHANQRSQAIHGRRPGTGR